MPISSCRPLHTCNHLYTCTCCTHACTYIIAGLFTSISVWRELDVTVVRTQTMFQRRTFARTRLHHSPFMHVTIIVSHGLARHLSPAVDLTTIGIVWKRAPSWRITQISEVTWKSSCYLPEFLLNNAAYCLLLLCVCTRHYLFPVRRQRW